MASLLHFSKKSCEGVHFFPWHEHWTYLVPVEGEYNWEAICASFAASKWCIKNVAESETTISQVKNPDGSIRTDAIRYHVLKPLR